MRGFSSEVSRILFWDDFSKGAGAALLKDDFKLSRLYSGTMGCGMSSMSLVGCLR